VNYVNYVPTGTVKNSEVVMAMTVIITVLGCDSLNALRIDAAGSTETSEI
jgi:hypothetical protein